MQAQTGRSKADLVDCVCLCPSLSAQDCRQKSKMIRSLSGSSSQVVLQAKIELSLERGVKNRRLATQRDLDPVKLQDCLDLKTRIRSSIYTSIFIYTRVDPSLSSDGSKVDLPDKWI